MKAELGKIYKFVGEEAYCYLAKYEGNSSMVSMPGGFMLFNKGDILQITCNKNQKPVSTISQDDFKQSNYDGKIIGAGTLEEANVLFKSALEASK